MLKSKIGSVQEVVLPDFPDDDNTVTTTVTKSRRVSFGTNFVKEFIVGSVVTAQCMSEYEQASQSSDSSNANSSQSASESMDHSSFAVQDGLRAHKSFQTPGPPSEPEVVDNRVKQPKFSSTICFTADSPTADMEFTEGCLTLAKSILDKKNKDMTVIIQAKPKEPKDEEKAKEEEIKYYNDNGGEESQFEMSTTRCLKPTEVNLREGKKFDSEKTKIFSKFEDEMSITRCNKIFTDDRSDSRWEESKENQMPLDMIIRHLDKDSSDLEDDLFNSEKSFNSMLNTTPLNFSNDSEESIFNEPVDMSIDLQQNVTKSSENIVSLATSVAKSHVASPAASPKSPVALLTPTSAAWLTASPAMSLTISPAKSTASPATSPTASPAIRPPVSSAASPIASPAIRPPVSSAASPTASPAISPPVSSAAPPTASPAICPPVSSAASPASPAIRPPVSSVASPTVSPAIRPPVSSVASPTASPAICPTASPAICPTVSPAICRTASPAICRTASPATCPIASPVASSAALPPKSQVASPGLFTTSPVASLSLELQDTTTCDSEPSLIDTKVIENLKEQSKEPGCMWSLENFEHPRTNVEGLLSFSCDLLESSTSIHFHLKMSKEDSLFSCSIVTSSEISLNKEKQWRLPEYQRTVEFGFQQLHKYHTDLKQKVETIRHVSYFLDQINSFMLKMNSLLQQIYSVLTLYPGSTLNGSLLSFRLFSFPMLFSSVVSIDLTSSFKLSKSSLLFVNDFGRIDENKIKEIFEDCLKCENSLCEFVVQSTKYLIDLERETGYVSKRGHIGLLPSEYKL